MIESFPKELESFNKEVERYKPKDMIDFSNEYFKCLQKGIPLKYNDLSGLEKYILTPEKEEIVERLNIPKEDLVRVINRRKVKSHDEVLDQLIAEFKKYSEMLEQNNGELNEQQKHNYLKFKTNTFRDNEFIRFLKGIEKLPHEKESNRIFFTKFYDLSDKEKQIIIDFCDLDYKIMKEKKIQSWKEQLIYLNNSMLHTYAPYDDLSQKLESFLKSYEKERKMTGIEDFDILVEKYSDTINEIKNYDEAQLYKFISGKYQFQRNIIYYILKIKVLSNSKDKAEVKKVYQLYDKIYNNSFSYLTELDYYDYILSCFIPLIKDSDKTSLEHREMESYLNHLILKIPKIYNINFEEEKNLYYNIECIKYFLSKENRIKTLEFKKIFIHIIQIFAEKVKKLGENLKFQTDIKKLFNMKFELINLQLKEFYPKLLSYINKMVDIAINYSFEGMSYEIQNSLMCQFKGHEKNDQILITTAMMMYEMFESDKTKQKGISDTIELLIKTMSIPEMGEEIREHGEKDKEIIPTRVINFYKTLLKQPRVDFNDINYLTFKTQVQIINLIIRNNLNLKNTAITYQNENINPYVDYDFMIEELFNYVILYFKVCFDKIMKPKIERSTNFLHNKYRTKFDKNYEFIKIIDKLIGEKSKDETYIEQFKKMNKFEQKLVLTYLNFSEDLNLDQKYNEVITSLSVIYLKDKIDYLKKLFNGPKASYIDKELFLDYIYDELKHVNYLIYTFVKYDSSEEIFVRFTQEEKDIVSDLFEILKKKNSIVKKDCLSFKEMIETEDYEKLLNDLKDNHRVVYEFVTTFEENQTDDMLNDFHLFNNQEREVILKLLKHDNKECQKLSEYHDTNNDSIAKQLKHIMLCEKDDNMNGPQGLDIRFFYHKLLLIIEKKMNPSMTECISLVLDYTFDPNNTYLKQDFLKFPLSEQLILLLDIITRQKITNYYTMYYEQNACAFMKEYLRIYIEISRRRVENEHFHKRITNDFYFLLKFFDESVYNFIKEIHDVDHQSIYKFLNEFSLDERKVICYFLEFYSILTQKDKYNVIKKELENYLEDLNYNERLTSIANQLDLIIKNEELKSMFIIVAESIKETANEVNYILEKITSPETEEEKNNQPDSFILHLYETFSKELRDITIKAIKCLREQGNNKKLTMYAEEFEKKLNEGVKPSVFLSIKDAFEKIDKKLIPNHDNSAQKPEYEKLKTTLSPLCGDLFDFVDKCQLGKFNLRKVKAISKDKIDIIKLVMCCDHSIQPNKKLKDASHTLSLLKFD